jgi:uncharacterized protein (UPF0210 family)
MNIRSITAFLDPGYPLHPERMERIGRCLGAARTALGELGYQVQHLRVATPPLAELEQPVPLDSRAEYAQQIEAECFVHGIDYANLGPALPDELEGYEVIPEILSTTETVFSSGMFADLHDGLSLKSAHKCAEIIQENSSLSPDGFTNLRFAALANVPPGSPFFPAAYHTGGATAIAIATEAADLALASVHEAVSLTTVRRRLVTTIEGHATAIERAVEPLCYQHEIRFLGIDFSLAPYPEPDRSLAAALEGLGASSIGNFGAATAAAFFADCLDDAQFKRTGFCGLFFPILEDTVLATRACEGSLSISDLLLYSTLCGTGLDTVPLPGDVTVESLYALLLDLGALALRHNKPLTARLMPIPGKAAGESVHYDFPYFADSCVLAIPDHVSTGLLIGSGALSIGPNLG